MKSKSDEQPATPARWANNSDWLEPVGKIPVFFRPFANVKTVAEFLEKYIEREKVERIAGFAFGLSDFGIPLPEWAKKASCQFWKNYIGNDPLNPTESVEDFGVLLKLVEVLSQDFSVMPKSLAHWPKLEKIFSNIGRKLISLCMEKLVSRLSDAEKSQFYAGRVRGEKILERLNDPDYLHMVKRAKVYLLIAITWPEIKQLATNADREEWLRFVSAELEAKKPATAPENGPNPKKINFPTTELSSREYYDVFQTIGLEGAPPGRPKSQKPEPLKLPDRDSK